MPEIFDRPKDICSIKDLVQIYGLNSEKERLELLSSLFLAESDEDIFAREFLWAISKMADPSNFELVKNLYQNPRLKSKDRLALQDWLALTGDARAMRILEEALKDRDAYIVSDAVNKLIWYYPGRETDRILSVYYPQAAQNLHSSINDYLVARGIDLNSLDIKANVENKTPFQTAGRALAAGNTLEAYEGYMAIINSKETNSYVLQESLLAALVNGEKLGGDKWREARQAILKRRLTWLEEKVEKGNYIECRQAVQILRHLKSQECATALTMALQHDDFIFDQATREATMGLQDLGRPARATAVKKLLAKVPAVSAAGYEAKKRYAIELAWLVDDTNRETVKKALSGDGQLSVLFADMAPLMKALAGGKNEAEALTGLLKAHVEKKGYTADQCKVGLDWLIIRLGELKEKSALPYLLDLFCHEMLYNNQIVSEALTALGGPAVGEAMGKLAKDDKFAARDRALEIYIAVTGAKSLPLCRQMVRVGPLACRVKAASALADFGDREDLALIKSLADYWSGDRPNHYWLMQALAKLSAKYTR